MLYYEKFKVLVKASGIPEGSSVCKPTGNKEYILKRELICYDESGNRINLTENNKSCFLVDENANISVIDKDKILAWEVFGYQLFDILKEEEEKLEGK